MRRSVKTQLTIATSSPHSPDSGVAQPDPAQAAKQQIRQLGLQPRLLSRQDRPDRRRQHAEGSAPGAEGVHGQEAQQ